MSKFLNLLEKLDDENKKRVLGLRTNQRRDYILSVSNLVGVNFWSEFDDLALDDIDSKLAAILQRSFDSPSIEHLAAALVQPDKPENIPNFLNKPVDKDNIPDIVKAS